MVRRRVAVTGVRAMIVMVLVMMIVIVMMMVVVMMVMVMMMMMMMMMMMVVVMIAMMVVVMIAMMMTMMVVVMIAGSRAPMGFSVAPQSLVRGAVHLLEPPLALLLVVHPLAHVPITAGAQCRVRTHIVKAYAHVADVRLLTG